MQCLNLEFIYAIDCILAINVNIKIYIYVYWCHLYQYFLINASKWGIF